ncbi:MULTISPECIES: helix-turn-helix domain-containing protein [Streptomyces]|uniref:Helix-turn-helix transcriptional regulator n=1 Tax=Streptomyces sudanensis TaxID=436397 RepID=A0ABY4TBS8_9ACTN|nr:MULTISPECIES: helix-turn-helix transcriptional regulator [Streptomyces]MCP9987771.1 helix-turn-helix transcriptional regulator [Streptomyces sudanensis]URN16410.1 helix-turn-helix transcriptional regulator [Streptomyces sudanensis]
MAARLGATGRRLELGIQLRQLRENCPPVEKERAKGMTRKEAVRGLKDISEATLARIENGEINFRRNLGNLRALLKRYSVTDPELVDQLVELNREAPGEDWLTQYVRFMPTGMPHFVGLEAEAVTITAYHPTLVYGLLQTERYAKALLETHRPVEDTTAESVKRNLEIRMQRKHRVLHPENRAPARLRIILGEAALRIPYGDEDVMREQYREIIRLTQEEHVSVQVMPFRRGYRSTNDFTILNLGSLPSRVQTDNAWGAVSTSDKPREVDRFSRRFDAMVGVALGVEETIDFLERLAEG